MKSNFWVIFSDVLSTVVGSFITLIAVITPVVIALSVNDKEVKIAAIVGGNLGGIAGASIARCQPTALASIVKEEEL
jgi:outer membrane lipoprotein SlyB